MFGLVMGEEGEGRGVSFLCQIDIGVLKELISSPAKVILSVAATKIVWV